MSYLRFSDDSDIYCFEGGPGWETHVAMSRRDPSDPYKRHPIGLPYDGQFFVDLTLEDFKARLLELRAAGYRFPDCALTRIDQELADKAAKAEREAAKARRKARVRDPRRWNTRY